MVRPQRGYENLDLGEDVPPPIRCHEPSPTRSSAARACFARYPYIAIIVVILILLLMNAIELYEMGYSVIKSRVENYSFQISEDFPQKIIEQLQPLLKAKKEA